MKSVWVLTTMYRTEERWHEDGLPIYDTYIDAVFASRESAMADPDANCCEDRPMRWYRPVHHGGRKDGRLYGFHRPFKGEDGGERHLHEIRAWEVEP